MARRRVTSASLWVASTRVVPSRFISSNRRISRSAMASSTLPVGSSASSRRGPRDHRARDGDALLLSARERRRPRVELVGEPDPVQQLARHARLTRVSSMPATRSGKRHVVEGGEMIDQAEILEHNADLAPQQGQRVARQRRQVLRRTAKTAPRDGTLGEIHEAQQRRLAGAARPGEEMERAGLEPQGDVAQHLGAGAIPHRDILEAHQASDSPRRTMARRAGSRPAKRAPRLAPSLPCLAWGPVL